MAKKPKSDEKAEAKSDRHKGKAFQLRMPHALKQGLRKLAERNFSTVTAEIIAAVADRLRAAKLLNGTIPPDKPDA